MNGSDGLRLEASTPYGRIIWILAPAVQRKLLSYPPAFQSLLREAIHIYLEITVKLAGGFTLSQERPETIWRIVHVAAVAAQNEMIAILDAIESGELPTCNNPECDKCRP